MLVGRPIGSQHERFIAKATFKSSIRHFSPSYLNLMLAVKILIKAKRGDTNMSILRTQGRDFRFMLRSPSIVLVEHRRRQIDFRDGNSAGKADFHFHPLGFLSGNRIFRFVGAEYS